MTMEATEMKGRITPEGVERLRTRIGIINPKDQMRERNTEAHADTIRHLARAYGDDNPLFTDPSYGPKTRWKSMIAPPVYVAGEDGGPLKLPDAVRKVGAGALTGVPWYQTGTEIEWLRPVYPGDRLRFYRFLDAIEERQSAFGGGKAIVSFTKTERVNQNDELVQVYRNAVYMVEREASSRAAKYKDIPAKIWTDEELAVIDRAYENETRRGADTLYFEDTAIGMEMPVMVKGPLCVTDILAWHAAIGPYFGAEPGRLGYLNRKRLPAIYTKNDCGVWDCATRMHWEDERARRMGHPRPFDYAPQRLAYVTHYITNWMGDDGFLWRISQDVKRFNYVGDVQWIKAKLTGKRIEETRNSVDLEIWTENQRDEVTSINRTAVLLPSRERGPVQIPARNARPTRRKSEYAMDIPGCRW